MGTYLSKPVTDKDSEEGELHACMQYGACAMQGWRRSMEDEHIAVELGAPPQWTAGGKAHQLVTSFVLTHPWSLCPPLLPRRTYRTPTLPSMAVGHPMCPPVPLSIA